jgi:hypothetical protein
MPTVKLKEATLNRINKIFESLFLGNSEIAQNLAKEATWDFKINAIMDRLTEAISKGG